VNVTAPDRGRYLRPADCGRDVGRSRAWVYGLVAAGELGAVRVAGAIRIPTDTWNAWLKDHVTPLGPRRKVAS
jgi:hypothetical protein